MFEGHQDGSEQGRKNSSFPAGPLFHAGEAAHASYDAIAQGYDGLASEGQLLF